MAHLLQVGAGSGGMPVLDMVCRDPRITHVTLIEPDVYKPHNVERHLFPLSAIGEDKAVLAKRWLLERRPDLVVELLPCDLCDPAQQDRIDAAAAVCDVGVCAADNEPAKYHWDALMRRHGKPWTLGEVLSGGIGGFVHRFVPNGPCYGCVASFLKRSVTVDKAPTPDYSQPGGPVHETTIPARMASIHSIASLHALLTLELLDQTSSPFLPSANEGKNEPRGFTSLLLTLQRVPEVFDEAFRPYRFHVPRAADCLICQARPTPSSVEELDVALDQALARLKMHDLWPLNRIGPRPQAMYFKYEKAGRTVEEQPIPWNAEAVLVEAHVRLSRNSTRRKADFQLRVPGQDLVAAEHMQPEGDEQHCLRFRLTPPGQTVAIELLCRDKALGQLTLPFLGKDEFLQNLRLQMPTLCVRIGTQTVACQTFVSSQCRGLLASAVLTSPTSLVPMLDLELQVEFRCERGGTATRVPVCLCSSQLGGRQALVTVVPKRYPRRMGTWVATWLLGDRPLASQRVRGISQRHFQRSLRISDTRFVIQATPDSVRLTRQVPPLESTKRLGPCFLVSSGEPGMAGECRLQITAQIPGAVSPPLLLEQDVLITDGPTMVAPGTLDAADLEQVSGFELSLRGQSLGVLSLCPAPTATFNGEGGFKPFHDYTWSAAAEEEMNERLNRLLEGRGKTE